MTPSEIADWLEKRGALFDEEAAATIRDLEDERDALVVGYTNIQHSRSEDRAKLKIATEALDLIMNDSPSTCETSLAHDMAQTASQAIARIKEV